jgi:hypothetical protein
MIMAEKYLTWENSIRRETSPSATFFTVSSTRTTLGSSPAFCHENPELCPVIVHFKIVRPYPVFEPLIAEQKVL